MDPCDRVIGEGSETAGNRLQDDSRRSRFLRAEDRHQVGGCDWTVVAALDRAGRLQPAATLWPRVRGGGWFTQTAGHGASRALRIDRALLRRADRALRGRVPRVAVA